jgi:hypothetical protein
MEHHAYQYLSRDITYWLIDTSDVSDLKYLPDWKINQSEGFVFG